MLNFKMSSHNSFSATRPSLNPTLATLLPLSPRNAVIPNVAPQFYISQLPCCTPKSRSKIPSQPLDLLIIQLSLPKSLSATRPALQPNVATLFPLSHSTRCETISSSTIQTEEVVLLYIQKSFHNSLSATRSDLFPTDAPQLSLSHSPCCITKFLSKIPSQLLATPYIQLSHQIPSQPLALMYIHLFLHNSLSATRPIVQPTIVPQFPSILSPCCTSK